tara:strand:+ start:2932 stop:3927 length:996 start_codon:yes stop_codon:yes gene_type:complete
MATYKDIHGNNIPIRASDPSNPITGEVWYNTTSRELKVLGFNTNGAWSSGGTMNTARGGFQGGAGASKNDGLIGGTSPTAVEQYDGTSWTTKSSPGSSASQRSWWGDSSSAAAQVSGLIWPNIQQITEEWDGSSWSSGGGFPTAIYTGGVTGSLNDAIYWQGFTSPGAQSNFSATYNGTSWTNAPNVPESAGYSPSGFGTGAAAVGYSGYTGGPNVQSTTAYEWNDTSWSATNPVNQRVQYGGGFGTQTAGVKCGGGAPPSAPTAPNTTETYDGTSFTINPNQLTNLRGGGASGGVADTSGLYSGGGAAPTQDTTEEWDGAGAATKIVSDS